MAASSGPNIIETGLVLALDAADKNSYIPPIIVYSVQCYSVYNGGLRSANYTVQYSDDNSTWTTAFTGVMSNNSSCGIITGTGVNTSNLTPHRYWRYVEGAAVAGHHPRVSRIDFITPTGGVYNLITSTADNCVDSGIYIIGTISKDFGPSTWTDLSGNNSISEFVVGPSFSNINSGTIYFDGGTSYCAITPSNNFAWTPSSIGLNNMTIDLWLKSSDSTGYILSKPWNGNGEYNYYLYFNGFFINTGNQSNAFNFSTVTTGNWINLVILVSTTQWGAYINGVQNVALTNHGITNNTPTNGNAQLQLTLMTLYPYGGGGNPGFSVQGNMGSFKIYNRVLTATEILRNYNATKTRFGL